MQLELPWPSRNLSPNTPMHWRKKAVHAAKARADAQLLASVLPCKITERTPVTLIFCPPDKRHYDIDGLLSRMKPSLDGIADAWKVNDRLFRPMLLDDGPVVKGGKVIVKVGE